MADTSSDQHAEYVRCEECGQEGCDLWEEIVTCPSCGREWGLYESEAGVRLFFQRLYDGWHVNSAGELVQ